MHCFAFHKYITDNAIIPGVIVELGFMSNEGDFALLNTSQGQKRFAKGIADGIIEAMTEINETEKNNE